MRCAQRAGGEDGSPKPTKRPVPPAASDLPAGAAALRAEGGVWVRGARSPGANFCSQSWSVTWHERPALGSLRVAAAARPTPRAEWGWGVSAPPQGRTRGRSFPFDRRRSFWPSRRLSHTVSTPTCFPLGPQSGRRSQRPWSLLTAGPRRRLANVLGSPRGNVPSAWPGRSCAEQVSHGSARSASGR